MHLFIQAVAAFLAKDGSVLVVLTAVGATWHPGVSSRVYLHLTLGYIHPPEHPNMGGATRLRMNLSTPDRAIKLLLVFLALSSGLGCAAGLAEAPFVSRAGSVEPGDLRGPFYGQILDADSGKPLSGATVLVCWDFVQGEGPSGPAGTLRRVVTTNADGRYAVPRVGVRGRRGRLARATLIAYQRGYLAYRSDRLYGDLGPRGDFSQSGNVVRLERFPNEGSHVRHLRFIGAGGPLAKAVAWELQLASEEAARLRPTWQESETGAAGDSRPIDATRLLSADELKAVTGYAGVFTIGKLGDRQTSPTYDSVHFRATGQPEKFDAAIRVFRDADAEAAELRYDELRHDYPEVEEKDEVGDRSLRSREKDIFGVVALDKARGLVVVFTCGVEQCHDHDTAVALMRRMWPRLGRVTAGRPRPAAPAGGEAEPAPEAAPGTPREEP
jgi:hypothetical protein